MAKVTKAEKMEKMRSEAIAKFELGETVKVGTGSYILSVEGGYVEVRFVVKGEAFDVAEAEVEYLRKVAEAEKRELEKSAKAEKAKAKA